MIYYTTDSGITYVVSVDVMTGSLGQPITFYGELEKLILYAKEISIETAGKQGWPTY